MANFILQGTVTDSVGNVTTSSVPITVTLSNCITSTATFQNSSFASQNGSFTATFDATPNGTAMDGVTGLSHGVATAYTNLGPIVRFSTSGLIDARNGGAYAAVTSIPYTVGTAYHFRIVVNIPSHTYSAFVTPAGGTEQVIGTGFAFRSEQAAVASLDNWALISEISNQTVCNFAISSSQPS